VAQKGGEEGSVKGYGGCWVLWSLCVLGCISTVVMEGEGAYVRDCRGLGVCTVGTVG
jgi:hypothetical protein